MNTIQNSQTNHLEDLYTLKGRYSGSYKRYSRSYGDAYNYYGGGQINGYNYYSGSASLKAQALFATVLGAAFATLFWIVSKITMSDAHCKFVNHDLLYISQLMVFTFWGIRLRPYERKVLFNWEVCKLGAFWLCLISNLLYAKSSLRLETHQIYFIIYSEDIF